MTRKKVEFSVKKILERVWASRFWWSTYELTAIVCILPVGSFVFHFGISRSDNSHNILICYGHLPRIGCNYRNLLINLPMWTMIFRTDVSMKNRFIGGVATYKLYIFLYLCGIFLLLMILPNRCSTCSKLPQPQPPTYSLATSVTPSKNGVTTSTQDGSLKMQSVTETPPQGCNPIMKCYHDHTRLQHPNTQCCQAYTTLQHQGKQWCQSYRGLQHYNTAQVTCNTDRRGGKVARGGWPLQTA